MTAWMMWAVVTTGLFAAAAHLLEQVLRASRRQARWAWVAAIVASLGSQVWSLVDVRQPRPVVGGAERGAVPSSALAGWQDSIEGFLAAPALERFDPYVGAFWLVASALLLTGLLGGLWRLHRRASRWPRQHVGSCDVLVSEDFGPALVGVMSPRVVLPRALLAHPADELALVCLHETEHRDAHDTWVLAAGALLATAMPWNAALWWQLRRLHAAVELDCDQRVLDTGISPTRYARVLLGIGTGFERLGLPIPALLQSSPPLERRLTMMITGVKRRGRIATLAPLTGAVLGVAAACGTPAPTTTPTSTTASSQGQIAGLRLPLRGVGEATLFFIDGEEVDRPALQGLDPAAIESIEVLKGWAAMDRYGDRAAGGVVQVTMKPD